MVGLRQHSRHRKQMGCSNFDRFFEEGDSTFDLGEQQAGIARSSRETPCLSHARETRSQQRRVRLAMHPQSVELKDQRHKRREELRVLRRQQSDQQELIANIEHRLHSARDVLRLKKEGIGRIEIVECPTCHRSLDPSTFQLTAQSTESVEAHIAALERDRTLVRATSLPPRSKSSASAPISQTSRFACVRQNEPSAPSTKPSERRVSNWRRRQADLATTETEMERVAETASGAARIANADQLPGSTKAGAAETVTTDGADLERRLKEFTAAVALNC